MIIISKWLSKITFGNTSYTFAFVWISISLIFIQLTNGQIVLLQGMRKLKQMAKASVVGSIGLFVSVPLFYFYGINGIVPSIILSSATSFILAWYFAKEIKIPYINVSKAQTIAEGKGMLTLGLMISLNGVITLGVSYLVRIYINNKGGLADVGLYAAGTAIINTYVGLVLVQ